MSQVREVGIPVRAVNRAQLFAGRNGAGEPCLYATMSQQAANLFVLQIDPETGRLRQFWPDVPDSNYTTAVYQARNGRLYIGAAHSGQLYCFDPEQDNLVNFGTINGKAAIFPCRIDEDSRGLIWISSYGTADLTSFNPETGEFTRYGRLDEVDMYASCYVNTDDTVASMIMQTRPHVVVLDPKTGEKRTVGPVVTRGEGTLTLHRGEDGNLYIESSEGNYRLEGMDAVPVDETVPAEAVKSALPDGSTFRFVDAVEQTCRILEVTGPDGAAKTFNIEFEAAGTDIFCLHGGPDGCVYGSSVLPERLFRFDPDKDDLTDLGICSTATGEAYSMANLDGKIYISSYPGARISIYDPSQPYHFGESRGSNPWDIGRVDNISYRPRSTLGGPGGKVWLASIPDYGRWGGPLSYYDAETEEKKAFYRIVGDGSCYTLAHLEAEALIAVGTNISAGSGTQPRVDEAVLFLFDYEEEEKVWEGAPDPPVTVFNALVSVPDGRLFGTFSGKERGSELFVFDPRDRAFTDRISAPEGGPVDNGLQLGPDGQIYGLTHTLIYRLDPDSLSVDVIVEFDERLIGHGAAGPIVGNDIYFSSGHRLMAAQIL
jgi:outer membrane protein assembly factor BamB